MNTLYARWYIACVLLILVPAFLFGYQPTSIDDGISLILGVGVGSAIIALVPFFIHKWVRESRHRAPSVPTTETPKKKIDYLSLGVAFALTFIVGQMFELGALWITLLAIGLYFLVRRLNRPFGTKPKTSDHVAGS